MAKNDPKPTTPTRTRSARSTGASKPSGKPPEPAAAAPSDLLDPTVPALELTVTTLAKPDQALLRRTMRFLVNVLEPGVADRARREGYTRQEHELGWQLWRTAAGENRPFEHWLREQELVDGLDLDNDEQRRRLQELDEFENTWFPRTRAIIRRVVKRDRRDAFAAAFFKDLVQQPLGPAVVGSVGTFLARLAGLETSTDPDAKAVRATLATRGLTPGKLAAIAQLIDDTKAGVSGSPAKAPVSTAELEQARLAQLDALEALRDWWNDWSVTLRPRYGTREQIKLGLTTSKKRGPSGGDGDGDGEIEDEDEAGTGEGIARADALVSA